MAAKKKTWFAILGLLSWKPLSGYDIKKLVEIGLSHFWSESYGQLYPTLDQLVAEGLARKKPAQSGKRKRFIFTITAKGRREFQNWLSQPTEPPQLRSEFQLKFFLSSRRPLAECLRLLQEYREQQQELYELYTTSDAILSQALDEDTLPEEMRGVLDDGSREQVLIFLLTLRHGVRSCEARLAWCDEAAQMLQDEVRRRASVA